MDDYRRYPSRKNRRVLMTRGAGFGVPATLQIQLSSHRLSKMPRLPHRLFRIPFKVG